MSIRHLECMWTIPEMSLVHTVFSGQSALLAFVKSYPWMYICASG